LFLKSKKNRARFVFVKRNPKWAGTKEENATSSQRGKRKEIKDPAARIPPLWGGGEKNLGGPEGRFRKKTAIPEKKLGEQESRGEPS